MKMFSEIEGNAVVFNAIVRGLYTVARVDGLHDREVKVISDLFRDRLAGSASRDDGGVEETLESLAQLPVVEPLVLATLLPAPKHRELFLTAAYLLAWADGKVSFAERASIDAFAAALGVGADVLARCEAEVKKHLLLKESQKDSPNGTSFV